MKETETEPLILHIDYFLFPKPCRNFVNFTHHFCTTLVTPFKMSSLLSYNFLYFYSLAIFRNFTITEIKSSPIMMYKDIYCSATGQTSITWSLARVWYGLISPYPFFYYKVRCAIINNYVLWGITGEKYHLIVNRFFLNHEIIFDIIMMP